MQDNTAESSSLRSSPSFFDLEFAKEKLLAELENCGSQSDPAGSPEKIFIVDLSSTESSQSDSSETEATKLIPSKGRRIDVNSVTDEESPKMQSMIRSSQMFVKEVYSGTPILKSCSSFKCLPPQEKFTKNICDRINYENLPGATGKYEQMSGLLQKVRARIADIHRE